MNKELENIELEIAEIDNIILDLEKEKKEVEKEIRRLKKIQREEVLRRKKEDK